MSSVSISPPILSFSHHSSYSYSFLLVPLYSPMDTPWPCTANGCPFPYPFPVDLITQAVTISPSVKHEPVITFLPQHLENQRVEYGFHPWNQSILGLTHPPRHTWSQFLLGPPADDHVDWVPYSGYQKFDLCMRYEYEDPTVFYSIVSSEYLILPITKVVYRRDPMLRWSEIDRCIRTKQVPQRYVNQGDGPMTVSWFRAMCRHFYINNNELHECSTHLQVVQASQDFETSCIVLPWTFGNLSPLELLQGIQSFTQGWYVDGLARATWFIASPSTYTPPPLLDN